MDDKFFDQAIKNFTFDVAGGGAIRHLADKGYSVKEISKRLTYPVSENQIKEVVWKHYLDTGVISFSGHKINEQVTYIKETGEYGRSYFRKVITRFPDDSEKESKYIECDFGLVIAKNYNEFDRLMSLLDNDDADYIRGIKWPDKIVYHIANQRMLRIKGRLDKKDI